MRASLLYLLPSTFHVAISCPFHVPRDPTTLDALVRRSIPARFSNTAIKNVRVFDGACFTSPTTVHIKEDKITFADQDVATTIDATGLFLIPGLIDSHIHIPSIAGLENATSYGMTTALNMACQNYTLCNALKGHAGLVDFKTAGLPAVGPNSSHAKFQHLQPWQLATDASNATELATGAKGNGSDYFKITLEINGPSYDLTRRLVAAAHAAGLPTMSHASDIAAYIQAIETKIDGIQHIPRDGKLTDQYVQQIKANGQFVTPTLAIFNAALHSGSTAILQFLGGAPGPSNNSWENVVYNTKAVYDAGIPMLAGTDAVGPIAPNVTLAFGETLHQEMEMFVKDIGMTPAEAINAATKVAAKYHHLTDRGEIKEGMKADLVLLGSDPLEDIRNTRDIVAIWAGGRKYPGKPASSK